MTHMLRKLVTDESGQDIIEYALLAAFISLASIVAMTALGTAISGKFVEVKDLLK